MTIIKESDYLWYNVGNIDGVPRVTEVYAFFSTGKIWLYVGSAGVGMLRHRIREHWRAGGWPDVYYFRWFQADSEDSARRTEREWIEKYKPKYNQLQTGPELGLSSFLPAKIDCNTTAPST